MAAYIFGKRSSIHIIDIRETVKGLLRARKFIAQVVTSGKDVLYVGTKRQARLYIQQYAARVNMPYVAERWLGGTLTNFRTIRSRLGRLQELEAAEANGTSLEYSKKMIASRGRELRKIRRNLDGIRTMAKLPGALIVVDVHRERNAVREAKKLGIPTVCLIDTDSDPDYADVPIPGNDDAMRAIETVLAHLTEAVEEGLKGRAPVEAEAESREPREPREPREAREPREPREPRRRSTRPATARAGRDGESWAGARAGESDDEMPAGPRRRDAAAPSDRGPRRDSAPATKPDAAAPSPSGPREADDSDLTPATAADGDPST